MDRAFSFHLRSVNRQIILSTKTSMGGCWSIEIGNCSLGSSIGTEEEEFSPRSPCSNLLGDCFPPEWFVRFQTPWKAETRRLPWTSHASDSGRTFWPALSPRRSTGRPWCPEPPWSPTGWPWFPRYIRNEELYQAQCLFYNKTKLDLLWFQRMLRESFEIMSSDHMDR